MTDRRRLLPEAPRPGYPALAGLRGLACLPVMLFHVASSTPFTTGPGVVPLLLAPIGLAAVMTFLWMSGFLIWLPVLTGHRRGRPVPRPGRFLGQRVARVYPMYWFALLVGVFVMRIDSFDPGEWLLMLSLAYVAVPEMFYRGLVVSWTLAVDMIFYVVVAASLPVLARAAPPDAGPARATLVQVRVIGGIIAATVGLVVVMLAIEAATDYDAGLLGGAPAVGLVIFTGAAWALAKSADRIPSWVVEGCRTPWLSVLVGVGFLLMAATFDIPRGLIGQPRTAPLVGCLVTLALTASAFALPAVVDPEGGSLYHRFLGTNPMRWLGELSYGIYVWQIPVLAILETQWGLDDVGDLLWGVPALTVGTFALAVPSYLLVETPARDAARRWIGSRVDLTEARR